MLKPKKTPSSCCAQREKNAADDRVAKLTEILRRLNKGEAPAVARQEAREFLASVSAADLSRAEQELIDGGTRPEELRHLCALHIEMVGEQATRMAAGLGPGHIIHTMVADNETILAVLDELVDVNRAIRHMGRHDDTRDEFHRLRRIARQLVEAEPHHRREEEVLFPELERRGISAPCQIIRTEHQEARARRSELVHLAEGAADMDFREFKTRLDTTATLLVLALRDHILNENGILYPTALEIIDDEAVWEKMKAESYRIGPMPVTPQA